MTNFFCAVFLINPNNLTTKLRLYVLIVLPRYFGHFHPDLQGTQQRDQGSFSPQITTDDMKHPSTLMLKAPCSSLMVSLYSLPLAF